jgi:hypothetical protein
MPMPPRIMTPRRFEALGAELLPTLQGIDDALGVVVVTLAPLTQRDLNTPFNAMVSPAFDSLATIDDPTDSAVVGEVLSGLDAGANDVVGQQRDLPGPESDEPTDESDQPFQDQPEPARDPSPDDPANRN